MKKRLVNKLYMEWLFIVVDYYLTTKGKELIYEIGVPIIVSLLVTVIYSLHGLVFYALEGLSNVLPTVMSFLIGFTVMLITLLMTISGQGVTVLKETKSNKTLRNKNLTLYQCLLIQFSHVLFSEVVLMLLVFLYLFWNGLGIPMLIAAFILFVQVYQVLNILLSIIRGVSNLYFSFFKEEE